MDTANIYLSIFVILCNQGINADLCPEGEPQIKHDYSNPSVFDDLSIEEMQNVQNYMMELEDFNIKRTTDEAALNETFIYLIEAIPPKKSEALAYLDSGGPKPKRFAKVVLYRGDLVRPVIEEYRVGYLPNPTKHSRIVLPKWRNPIPFSARLPLIDPQLLPMLEFLGEELKAVDHILLESTGYSWNNCSKFENCLTWYPTTPANFGTPDVHKLWVYLLRIVEGYVLHPIGLQMLLNLDSPNVEDWYVEKVWFRGKIFRDFSAMATHYGNSRNTVEKLKMPTRDKNLFSSMHFRGSPKPEKPQQGPSSFEPDGKRYKVSGHTVEWQGWSFSFNVRSSTGPQVHNIKFKNERIAYEISLQEIAVMYSGSSPSLMHQSFYDSLVNLGGFMFQLFRDVDCPGHATFFDFAHYSNGKPTLSKDSVCLFEHDRGIPLRRHYESDHLGSYYFFQGMRDIVLVLRAIPVIYNYDYIYDLMFHQDGKIEVKVSLSGYTLGQYYMGETDDKYGFKIAPDYIAPVHNHFANIKVDLDIKGTANRFETISITAKPEQDPYYESTTIYNRQIERNVQRSELDAAYKFNFDTPKYLLFYNEAETNKYGNNRAYRIIPQHMTKLLVPEGHMATKAGAWMNYQVAVTKHKDDEDTSSSIYNTLEAFDPVVDFQSYLDDNDNIVDEDLVVWVTLGSLHVPHSEDIPVVTTPGVQLTFFLVPYNYFDEDPSLASRDNIRVTPDDNLDPVYEYAGVKDTVDCQPRLYNNAGKLTSHAWLMDLQYSVMLCALVLHGFLSSSL